MGEEVGERGEGRVGEIRRDGGRWGGGRWGGGAREVCKARMEEGGLVELDVEGGGKVDRLYIGTSFQYRSKQQQLLKRSRREPKRRRVHPRDPN